MKIQDHLAVLREDGLRLADAAARAGLDAPVPTCPEWQVRDLLRHTGGVHRWAAAYVARGQREPFPSDDEFFASGTDLVGWYREAHAELVDTLSGADESVECWSFLPAPSPLAFWARRQAHETAIHRADAAAAAGEPVSWPPEFAADGIEELLFCFYARPGGRLVADPPVSLALVPSDVEGAWTLHVEPDGRRTVPALEPADLTVSGPAAELYLLLWNRRGTDGLDLTGDPAVLDLWREKARIRWT